MDVDMEVAKVISELKKYKDPKRKELSKGYYPSSMDILGVKVPDQRMVTNSLRKRIRGTASEEVLELAYALLDTNIFECQQVAFEVIAKDKKVLSIVGPGELLILRKGLDNWVSVDTFSSCIAGVLWREGRIDDDTIIEWAGAEDRWTRRSALVSTIALNQRARGGTGDVARTLLICGLLAGDRDEMVVKAMSWALRELSKVDRDPVEIFIRIHEGVLHKKVLREVSKKLSTGRKNG